MVKFLMGMDAIMHYRNLGIGDVVVLVDDTLRIMADCHNPIRGLQAVLFNLQYNGMAGSSAAVNLSSVYLGHEGDVLAFGLCHFLGGHASIKGEPFMGVDH